MHIEHIAMYVNDLEGAKNFFVKYFDAKANCGYFNEATGFRSYFLTFENSARLEIMSKPDISKCENQTMRNGFIHIAFSLGSKSAVDKLTDLLRSDGFTVLSGPRTTGDGYYESCIAAFEGNVIELTV